MTKFSPDKIEISVVIPTHNRVDSLRQLLHALSMQDINPALFETIIVSNGNDEITNNKLCMMAEDILSKNIHHFFKLSTPGVSNARNFGLNNSHGKYIAFIDDDDLVSPQYLSGLFSIADDKSIIIGKEQIFENNVEHCHDGYYTHLYNNMCSGNIFSLSEKVGIMSCAHSKLIPRALIGDFQFSTKLSLSEDTVFMSKMLTANLQLKPAPEQAVYFRRKTTDSLSRGKHSSLYYIRVALICDSIYLRDFMMSKNKNIHILFRLMQAPWRRVLKIQ